MVTVKQIKKWVFALRSGEYKQTKYYLQDKKGYCCLGVGCKVFITKNKLVFQNGFLIGSTPRCGQKNAPDWLKNINTDFSKKTGLKSLINMNDFDNYTFDEIADCLEQVYIHKILK